MDIGKFLEKSMGMDDAVWTRHANPISGWSRMTTLPMIALAIWSRAWLGWWALVVLAGVIVWVLANPRVFPKPRSTNNWMSKGVLGERVWLNRKQVAIPHHHAIWANILSLGTGIGMLPFGWGLWQFSIWPTLLGLVILMLGKLWFLDRMVWLFEDMKAEHAAYRALLY